MVTAERHDSHNSDARPGFSDLSDFERWETFRYAM